LAATAAAAYRRAVRRIGIVSLLALLGASARLPAVWAHPLSQDEVFSARIATTHSLIGAFHRILRTESTPPLWYALAWLGSRLGAPLLDLRLLSVACGAALSAVTFLLARRFLGEWAAAAGAALTAVSYQPLVHGAQLRAYELLTVLVVALALLLALELREPRRALDVAVGATVWAGLLTHYFFVYAALVALIWTWLEPAARPVRRRVTVAFAVGAALAAPWLPAFLIQYRKDHFWWIARFSPAIVVTTPLRELVPLGAGAIGAGLLVLAVVVGGVVRLSRISAEARLVGALAVGPIALAALAWAAGARTYDVRNLVATAPFLALGVTAALSAVPRRVVATAAAASALASVAWLSLAQASLPGPPFARLAGDLVALGWTPADPIAVAGNVFTYRAPLEWYLPHGPLFDVSRPTGAGCGAVFVIARSRAFAEGLRGVRSARRDGGFVVDRLRRLPPRSRWLTILATRKTPRSCVRPLQSRNLAPLA